MRLIDEIQDIKTCLDSLLQAHNAFDSAMRYVDHDAMLLAQLRIEKARFKATLASKRLDATFNQIERLNRMIEE